MPRPRRPRTLARAQAGVTLIQLLITVVIIGILASIAVRSLSKTRLRATRQDAASCLTQAADRQEAFYLRSNGYANNLGQLGLAAACGANAAYTLATMTCGSGIAVTGAGVTASDPCYGFQASPNAALQAGQAQIPDGTLKLEVHFTQQRPDLRFVKTRQPPSGAVVSGWQ